MPKTRMNHLLLQQTSNELKTVILQLTPSSSFDVFKADLSILMNRYQEEKSFFSVVAGWYYEM